MVLKANSLRVEYSKVPAVRDISFEINEGEIVGLVGPNGAGKSTTALAVAGILKPAAGTVEFGGEVISGKSAEYIASKGMSLVPEGRRIFGRMTVQENLMVATGIPRARARAKQSLERAFDLFPILSERRSRLAGMLSGGEQQQLAIARAMMTSPRLLIVDEPSLGLAPMYVDLVFATFATLRREGMTILVIEQSSKRALDLANRIYLVRSGAVVLSGSVEELASDAGFEKAYFGETQIL
jgi:branched-chain amino acid transport system ATP-binding protein